MASKRTVPSAGQAGAAGPVSSGLPVSVSVPCYNGGHFLDGLMASLGSQTLPPHEIIIVNDGSTDAATLRKLAELEGSVRVIHQENRGLSAARNAGIRAARTELVLTIDCDDRIEPPFLAEAAALMQAAPADVALAFSHMRLTGSAQGLLVRRFNRFDLLFTNTLPSGLLLRRSIWDAVGGYDEAMREGYEDWEFYLRLAGAGYDAVEIPKPYFHYAIANEGMLLGKSSQVHAKLWRDIRRKHAPLYRPWTMLRQWWKSRNDAGHVSLPKGLAAYALAMLLPDAWFSRLVTGLRRRTLLEGRQPAYVARPAKSKLAAQS